VLRSQVMARDGRPSKYTDEIADEICRRISTSRYGLEEVCEMLEVPDSERPSTTAVFHWLENNASFREKYSRSRELQAEYMGDLMVQEAHRPRIATVKKSGAKGVEEIVSDNVERSKLIVSTLLKRASQLYPKKYGERSQLEHVGRDGGPIQFQAKSILEE
jgi:hypothetical protein